jgi:hypothetical protein
MIARLNLLLVALVAASALAKSLRDVDVPLDNARGAQILQRIQNKAHKAAYHELIDHAAMKAGLAKALPAHEQPDVQVHRQLSGFNWNKVVATHTHAHSYTHIHTNPHIFSST